MRGQIKKGAGIFQDHLFCRWPDCWTPPKDPNMFFDVEWNGIFWVCEAPGYGSKEDYGYGSIFVKKFDDVLVVDEDLENEPN